MAVDRDPFDVDCLRIDPTDPVFAHAARSGKKKWQRKFILFPWAWLGRLKATRRGATCRLALFLVYEHWRTGGRTIRLTNIMAAEVGVSRRTKSLALNELEQ